MPDMKPVESRDMRLSAWSVLAVVAAVAVLLSVAAWLLFRNLNDAEVGASPSTVISTTLTPQPTIAGEPGLVVSDAVIGPGDHVSIRVVAAGAVGSEIEVRASMDSGGTRFESFAVFAVGSGGVVDLDAQAPLRGSYDVADATGLLWSLAPPEDQQPSESLRPTIDDDDFTDRIVQLSLVLNDRVVHEQSIVLDPAPGVEIVAATTDLGAGFSAALLADPNQCPCPVVVRFGGSDGGMRSQPAAALASHGFAIMVVGYFGLPGLPRDLSEIEVGLIEPALDWALEHDVAAEPAAVWGRSRGSVLAIEAALRDDRVAAVVVNAPSSVRWSDGAEVDDAIPELAGPVWMDNGQPLPFLSMVGFPGLSRGIWILRPVFDRALEAVDADSEPAFLAVEDLDAPLLVISGGDDQLWPSARMADQIVERRCTAGTSAETVGVVYTEAGHSFGVPPPMPIGPLTYELGPYTMALGGTRSANAAASRESWTTVHRFLDHHLKNGERTGYASPSC